MKTAVVLIAIPFYLAVLSAGWYLGKIYAMKITFGRSRNNGETTEKEV